ncbi:C-C motif chemokine 4-like [Monodelphis domestica]|uniref:C-C motif chemokine 4-like n=1 Tax=Monodelphis domestica TaxID=13616 RepID=UPI00044346A8|nr:C-C motif chemokine 4-like [Monodelphis domestica]
MKFLVAALSVLLLVDFSLMMANKSGPLSSPPFSQELEPEPLACCKDFVRKRIPQSFMLGYTRSNPRCSKPAIMFETNKGVKVCANPHTPWVRNYVRNLGGSVGTEEEEGILV